MLPLRLLRQQITYARRTPLLLRHLPINVAARLCSHTASAATTATTDDDFGGLRLHDTAVQRFLRSIRTEYDDLARSDQRSRAGHQRLAALQPLIALLDEQTEQQQQLAQLLDEMRAEKDAELLALIDDEKKVPLMS